MAKAELPDEPDTARHTQTAEALDRLDSKPARSNANAGKKVVDRLHVVFRASDRVVKSIHADQPSALLAAQSDLLKPGAEIHGVVEVGLGDDVAEAIEALLAEAQRA